VNDTQRILVVDDEPESLQLTARVLQRAGYDIAMAQSGRECMRLVNNQQPDLILLDVVLPDANGIELCKRIKQAPDPSGAYVVLLSASETDSESQAAGLESGADGYIARPISNRELVARVQAMFRLKRTEEELRRHEQALLDSRQFLQSALDALSANIAVLDQHGVIIAVNASWCRFGSENGLTWSDGGVGKSYLSVLDTPAGPHSAGAKEAARGIRQVIAGHRDLFWQEYPCHSPSEQRWYAMWVTRFESSNGPRAVVAHENVTQRKLAESALRKAKEDADTARREAEAARKQETQRRMEADRRRRIAEGLRDVLSLLNSTRSLQDILDHIVIQASLLLGSEAAAIYQGAADDGDLALQAAQGLPVECTSPTLMPAAAGALQRVLSTRKPVSIGDVTTVQTTCPPPIDAACSSRYQSLLAVPILLQEEAFGGLLLYYTHRHTFDSEELELAAIFAEQVALAIENEQLREQVERSAIAAERNRLARDLHDAVTQTLFSASVIAESVSRIWDRYPEQAQQGLLELRQLTRGALAEMRTLLLELRPAALTEKPLGELIHSLADATTSRIRVPIAIEIQGEAHLPPTVQVALYRIAQEALNNIAKHSRATHTSVHLTTSSTAVILDIHDDGSGFNLDGIPAGHLGVSIMRERAHSIGADLQIDSAPNSGTHITVVWHH